MTLIGNMRRCPNCKQEKDVPEFYKDRAGMCKACLRERSKVYMQRYLAKRLYGITDEEYDVLEALRQHGCMICGRPEDHRRLHIDHNHDTGEVRGLLCSHCNSALGWMQNHEDKIGGYLGK